MEESLGVEWLPKALVWAFGQLAIGLVVVRGLAASRSRPGIGFERWTTRRAAWIGVALLVALLARLWVHTATALGTGESWAGDLTIIAFESRWGAAWRLQVYAALAVQVGALVARLRPSGWALFAAGACGLSLASPALGHATESAPRYLLHLLHNLSAASWLGSLGVLTLLALGGSPAATTDVDRSRVFARFSPIALGAAALVFASGLVLANLSLDGWRSLWTTSYGRVLLAKVGLVTPVLACGWINSRRISRGSVPATRMLVSEWVAAIVVLLATGILTETEHP